MNHLATALCLAGLVGSLTESVPSQGARYHQSSAARLDRYAAVSHAPRALDLGGRAFVFHAGGQLMESGQPGDQARLTGVLAEIGNPNARLLIDASFSAHTGPSSSVPAGSPRLALVPGAYAQSGGPVDPATWEYYASGQITLTGLGDLDGALVVGALATALQLGDGASGKNVDLGASATFDVSVARQPSSGSLAATSGELNLDLGHGSECAYRYRANEHAVYLPGISRDFVFKGGHGVFHERADGTASLQGEIVDLNDPTRGFLVDVELRGRVVPGEVAYPPAGSPKKELGSSQYAGNGGLIDPGAWHYYLETDGVLTGVDALAGAVLEIYRMGPAFQVGFGANGKRADYGASGWFHVNVLQHPTQGPALSISKGDFNVRLDRECPPPPPCLEQPTTAQSLPLITHDCFTLKGCALTGVDVVHFGTREITSRESRDWHDGYFEIVDDETICVHPPICLPPGTYNVAVSAAGNRSTGVQVQLTRPTDPTLGTHDLMLAGETQYIFVHPGAPRGRWAPILFVSTSNQPSSIPGIVDLGLGAAWTSFAYCMTSKYDPASDCASFGPMVIPGGLSFTLYWQAIIVDLPAPIVPLPVTNVEATVYR